MSVKRFHTRTGEEVTATVRWQTITDAAGDVYQVPAGWSHAAADVALRAFFYQGMLPEVRVFLPEAQVPQWLWRQAPAPGSAMTSRGEGDFRQVLHRLAGAWTYRAWKAGMWDQEEEARSFYDEARYLLLHRNFCPEMSIWAQDGLNWAYGALATEIKHKGGTERLQGSDVIFALERRAQQQIKDGGTATAILRIDHPEADAFIAWKKDGDLKRLAEKAGLKTLTQVLGAVMEACDRDQYPDGFDPAKTPVLKAATRRAREAGIDPATIAQAIAYAREGYEEMPLPRFDEDAPLLQDAMTPVLSMGDDFVEAALTDHSFLADHRHIGARAHWETLAETMWAVGAPHVLFHDRLEDTVGIDRIVVPSATLSLPTFASPESLSHAVQVVTVALETMADGVDRPLRLTALGIADFAMQQAVAYDSAEGRATAAAAMAVLAAATYKASSNIAQRLGCYPAFNGIRAAATLGTMKRQLSLCESEGRTALGRPPLCLDLCADRSWKKAAVQVWTESIEGARDTGLRHHLKIGIATDPSIAAFLDLDAVGCAPLLRAVKGDGEEDVYTRRLHPAVTQGLGRLGLSAAAHDDVHFHVLGHGTLLDAPLLNHESLRNRGLSRTVLQAVEGALKTATHIRHAFNPATLGMDVWTMDFLKEIGFDEEVIEQANVYCCGARSLVDVPGLTPPQREIFALGATPESQLKMQSAVETFTTEAAAHVISLPAATSIDEIRVLLQKAWEWGIKRIAFYRDPAFFLSSLSFTARSKR